MIIVGNLGKQQGIPFIIDFFYTLSDNSDALFLYKRWSGISQAVGDSRRDETIKYGADVTASEGVLRPHER